MKNIKKDNSSSFKNVNFDHTMSTIFFCHDLKDFEIAKFILHVKKCRMGRRIFFVSNSQVKIVLLVKLRPNY